MAVSSVVARSLRIPSSSSSSSCSSSLLLTHIHFHIGRRYFAHAVKLNCTTVSSRIKKKSNPSASSITSWDEAGSVFFASKNANAEDSSSEKWSRDMEGGSYGGNKEYRGKERILYTKESEKVKTSHGKYSGRNDFASGNERSTARGNSDGNFSRKQFSDVGNSDFDARRVNSKVKPVGFREQFSDYNGVTGKSRRDRDQSSFREQFSGRGNQGSSRERFSSRGMHGGLRDRFTDSQGKTVHRNEGNIRGTYFSRNEMLNNDSDYDDYDNTGTANSDQGRNQVGFRGQFSSSSGNMNRMSNFRERFSRDPGKVTSRNDKSRGRDFPRKHSDDVVDDNEDEDDNSESYDLSDEEETPQAGDVIRYNGRKRSPRGMDHKSSDGGEEEEENDEDDFEVYPTRNVGWRNDSSGSSIPRLRGESIYGVAPVYAALRIARRELFCLYVQANMPMNGGKSKKKDKKALEWILKSAIEKDLEVKEISKHDLNMLADNRPHQGLVLDASPLELINVISLDAPWGECEKPPVWVALDEVQDPQNFGAILRSAYFLGATGVAVCAKNSAPLSAVVSKASAGALEVMELRSCKNMMKFLEISAKNGWRVVGATSAGPDVIPVRNLPCGVPTILVLGGEGNGLRTNVRMACQHFVCIPGSHEGSGTKQVLGESVDKMQDNGLSIGVGDTDDADDNVIKQDLHGLGHGKRRVDENFTAVDSLNVSVAAGILLHELLDSSSRIVAHTPETLS